MTALVSLSAGGAITGFSFVPKAAADISSPASMPLNLLALRQSGHSARPAPGADAMLRTAIVNVAQYYLRMAQNKTPAEMEAIIWQHDSIDGADHGQSCAAFASLTLELGAQVVGQQSWVSGGSSYPWPLHSWADVRVGPNPDSLGIISIQQDAQAQHRWHPLGDGYRPRPGDWVLFDGHVEVITEDSDGVLHTVGGDSLPNFSVNAHEYRAPLSGAGVVGFVNNGSLAAAKAEGGTAATASGGQSATSSGGQRATPSGGQGATSSGGQDATSTDGAGPTADAAHGATVGLAAIPGTSQAGARQSGSRASGSAERGSRNSAHSRAGDAAIPGLAVPAPRSGPAAEKAADRRSAPRVARVARGDAAIPGLEVAADLTSGHHGAAYRRHHPSPARKPVSETRVQQAFISEVAAGAIAAQHRYGVPAAVTIAQAIDESGWGQSQLAAQDHNLFGIKGTGPAGSVPMPTQEYVNGQPVSTSASFRVYHNAAQSIDDHGRLLARSGYYQQAMAERQHPDRFAAALTGVYATDPNYGANLISLMRRYDLYRYSNSHAGRPHHGPAVAAPGSAAIPGVPGSASPPAPPRASASPPASSPQPTRTATPPPTGTASPQPTRTASPQPTRTASPAPTQTASPEPTQTASPEPTRTASPQPTRTASPEPTQTRSPLPTGTARPQPTQTGAPDPSATGSPNGARTATPRPAAGPRAADASGPPAKTRRATPAARPSPSASRPTLAPPPASSQADIPGLTTQSEHDRPLTSAVSFGPGARFVPVTRSTSSRTASARSAQAPARPAPAARRAAKARSGAAPVRATLVSMRRYQPHMPRSVLNSFVQTAKGPLLSEETLYRDVASFRGIDWQLLAACDWMQCDARPRRSPVYGERLGSRNADGTVYTSRSAALARCADDLIRLARTVYGIDLTGRRDLSVRDLANAFAAFRWGALLKTHDCSALEFPYSVAGLTEHHLGMRWPRITAPGTGDRPGSRYRRPFGAVPIVLGLDYPATV
jgi:flagellum-specific peptidoglycan hydrolase FlgJ